MAGTIEVSTINIVSPNDLVTKAITATNDGFMLVEGWEQSFTVALSDEVVALTTGTTKLSFRAPFPMILTKIPRASVSVASSSGIPTVDINKNGASIFSTTLTIDANEKTSVTAATACVLSTTTFADDDEISFDVDVAGTGTKGLKVTLYYART